MNLAYSWSIEGEAFRYLISLTKRRRKGLERAIEAIASHPFQRALFTDRDADGLPLEILAAEGYLITYHPDHALRCIRVTEIQPF